MSSYFQDLLFSGFPSSMFYMSRKTVVQSSKANLCGILKIIVMKKEKVVLGPLDIASQKVMYICITWCETEKTHCWGKEMFELVTSLSYMKVYSQLLQIDCFLITY